MPGVILVSAGVFCLVYGFSNAATHDWSTPSTYGFLAVGVVLLAMFAFWMSRARYPLLPPRVVLDRNRGAAYLGILIVGAGMFGIFLFLTYYLQDTLRYSPVITGVAFLPMIAGVATSSNVSNIVLMPRIGPKPIVTAGLVLAAAGMAWLTQITPHSSYAANILGPIIVTGLGMGLMSRRRSTPALTGCARRTRASLRRRSTLASSSAARWAPRCLTRSRPARPSAT